MRVYTTGSAGDVCFGEAVVLGHNATKTGKVERCKTFDDHGWSDPVRDVHIQKRPWWDRREIRNSTSHELSQSQARTPWCDMDAVRGPDGGWHQSGARSSGWPPLILAGLKLGYSPHTAGRTRQTREGV